MSLFTLSVRPLPIVSASGFGRVCDSRRSRKRRGRWRSLPTMALVLALPACDWVDSTGVQESAPLLQLEEGQVVELTEGQARTLDPTTTVDPDGEYANWRWGAQPTQAGALAACSAVDGFRTELAAASITNACVKDSDCGLFFEPLTGEDGRALFRLVPPQLKAPVGVQYQLIGTNAAGAERRSNFTFCLVAINEGPDAADDTFTVELGQALVVTRNDANLLSNDTDDVDVGNQPLSVVTPASREPRFASQFVLGTDGGFVYVPDADLDFTTIGRLSDSFDYVITDGSSTSEATATINIVGEDQPPLVDGPIPDIEVVVGIDADVMLADFFSDPEGAQLSFDIVSGLPDAGTLELTPSGVLQGMAAQADLGEWPVVISAADTTHVVDALFTLNVVANLPPVAGNIPDQIIASGASYRFNTASFFSDPENQSLTYALNGPELFQINRQTGLITATPIVAGEVELVVMVSDGFNTPVSESFTLTVLPAANRAPVFSGSIASRTLILEESITPIEGQFDDPDNDELIYSLIGILPDGLDFDEDDGSISGEPEEVGSFTGLRIVASDPDGLAATSNAFTLNVVDSENQIPVRILEVNGLVSLEAESFDSLLASGDYSWIPFVDGDAASAVAMQALPDTGVRLDTPGDGPELSFRVRFDSAGARYLWVRGLGISKGNSLHVGLNNQPVASAENIQLPLDWGWSNELDNGLAVLTIPSAGVHTINVWMREDGAVLDKLLLTTNAFFTPVDDGPPETLNPDF